MDLFTAIAERRAVKKFDPAHRMAPEEINRLMESVLLSPTSFNIQNWRFVLVTDPEIKQRIREKGYQQAQFTDCSLLVVICGDRNAFGRDTERYWANAAPEVRQMVVPMIHGAYAGNEQLQRDENMRSGGLAAQTLMLAAKAIGYDSCPMIGFDFQGVADVIRLPQDHDIVMAVAVGMALEPARERGGQLPLEEVTFHDSF